MQNSLRLTNAVEEALPKLLSIAEDQAGRRANGADGWSRKQELGHLIDSATNNRARFVVAGLTGNYEGPSYDGEGWVELGGYSKLPWIDLVELWERLNRALALVMHRIPPDRLTAPCKVGGGEPVALEFLMDDYVSHMATHLKHILQGA
jgi:DinB superfamily